MNKERLNKLLDLLKRPLPKNTIFDLKIYSDESSGITKCCALGLAVNDSWFKEQHFIPDGRYKLMDVVCFFFEISEKDANFLFEAENYDDTSLNSVIQRLENFIK